MSQLQQSLFKKSSKTFYYSTLFFPKNIKIDIHLLYAFVRTADDYVDNIPQDGAWFYSFKEDSFYYLDNFDQTSSNPIISWFVQVYRKYDFKREWVESFLEAMQSDLWEVHMNNKQELEYYMYGSAAAVWKMMCWIFWIRDPGSLYAAKMLAYSMQCINFVRDVEEDNILERRYLFDTKEIKYEWRIIPDKNLHIFLDAHIQNYYSYLSEAQEWLYNLPLFFRVPVLTASNMYEWTAREIKKNPWIVFEKKIKPSKPRIIFCTLCNLCIESMRGLRFTRS